MANFYHLGLDHRLDLVISLRVCPPCPNSAIWEYLFRLPAMQRRGWNVLIRDAGQGTPPPEWRGQPHYLPSAMISGLLLVLSASSAFAETISSILTVDQREAVYSWSAINVCGPYTCSGTLQETCNCTAAKSTGCGADPTVTLSCAVINELTAGMYFVNNRGESGWSYATRYCDQEYPFNPTTLKCEKKTYTCPSTGGWTLSSDRQTCSRCPDSNLPILTPEGSCIGPMDKITGTQDCQSSNGHSSDPFLE